MNKGRETEENPESPENHDPDDATPTIPAGQFLTRKCTAVSRHSSFDTSPFSFRSCHFLHQSLIHLILLHLGLLNLARVKLCYLFRSFSVLSFIGFGDNLAEARMLRVPLVVVRTFLGLQLGAELVKYYREDAVD